MKNSLINPNYIQFNSLEFFDNPILDNKMYIDMDNELNVPVQFKGTKCIFSSHVPARAELDMCQNFYMTSHNE